MEENLTTKDLSIGYDKKPLIEEIGLSFEPGKLYTLIGPNGAGKSTMLKTLIGQLPAVEGAVYLDGKSTEDWGAGALAKEMAVVLTERINPELTTCAEVVAMGRYSYTGWFGKLTQADEKAVFDALCRVGALDLADREFVTLSDGQKQRIMLARAIAQEPKILLLDEPTAYLDIRYKVDLLDILRDMATEKNMTVIMSLHEIDLALKASDEIICVKGERLGPHGAPESILKDRIIEKLYDLEDGSYNLLFGSVELKKPEGEPKTFVLAGGGSGIPVYRELQKKGVPFKTGVLAENDVDFQAAKQLSSEVFSYPAFTEPDDKVLNQALEALRGSERLIDAGPPEGPYNTFVQKIREEAEKNGLTLTRAGGRDA